MASDKKFHTPVPVKGTEKDTGRPPFYEVRLKVGGAKISGYQASLLMDVFKNMSAAKAVACLSRAFNDGESVLMTTTYEVAETKRDELFERRHVMKAQDQSVSFMDFDIERV